MSCKNKVLNRFLRSIEESWTWGDRQIPVVPSQWAQPTQEAPGQQEIVFKKKMSDTWSVPEAVLWPPYTYTPVHTWMACAHTHTCRSTHIQINDGGASETGKHLLFWCAQIPVIADVRSSFLSSLLSQGHFPSAFRTVDSCGLLLPTCWGCGRRWDKFVMLFVK